MGIGGQYAAINSAIDEMMPSKYRGRVDIWINGSYWAGAILGSFVSLIFLNAFAVNVGWRLAFLMGPVLALVVIVVARTLPESPRWLMTHGRLEEAEPSSERSRTWRGAAARRWTRWTTATQSRCNRRNSTDTWSSSDWSSVNIPSAPSWAPP